MRDLELQKEFLAFREQCIWFRSCYNTYHKLFETGEATTKLLSKVAPLFFTDLNIILIEYCWLQICKLSDPASSFGRDNLTINYLNKKLLSAGLITSEIIDYTKKIETYRGFINTGQNRLVSHLDEETVLTGGFVDEHSYADVEKFLCHLQKYVDAVGEVVGVGPLDFSGTAGPGDVTELLMKLKRLA